MHNVFASTYTPKDRFKRPAAARVHRTAADWKKIITDAKEKENNWTKGLVAGTVANIDSINSKVDNDYNKSFKVR